MTTSRLHSFLPQLRETSLTMSTSYRSDEGDGSCGSTSSPSSYTRKPQNVYNKTRKQSNDGVINLLNHNSKVSFEKNLQPTISNIDEGRTTTSCLPRSDIALRMYETVARVQSNRRSRRNRLQQRQGQHQHDKCSEDEKNSSLHTQAPLKSDVLTIPLLLANDEKQLQREKVKSVAKQSITLQHEPRVQPLYPQTLNLPRPGMSPIYSPSSMLVVDRKQFSLASPDRNATAKSENPNSIESHMNSHYDPIRRNAPGTPVLFRDNVSVDNTSVCTGLSQQDLLRKKVRQQKMSQRNRQRNVLTTNNLNGSNSNNRKAKKKKATIVQIPTNLLPPSSPNSRYYRKASSRTDGSELEGCFNSFETNEENQFHSVWNSNEIKDESPRQQQQQLSLMSSKRSKTTPNSSSTDSTADNTSDDNENVNDIQSVHSFPLLSRSAKNGGFLDFNANPVPSNFALEETMESPTFTKPARNEEDLLLSPPIVKNLASALDTPSEVLKCRAISFNEQSHSSMKKKEHESRKETTAATILLTSNESNPCETSFTTTSTENTTGTSVVSANRVRFSEVIATFLGPERRTKNSSQDLGESRRSAERTEGTNSDLKEVELPWDEDAVLKVDGGSLRCLTGGVPNNEQKPGFQSILRTPKFSTKQNPSVSASTVLKETASMQRRSSRLSSEDREARAIWSPESTPVSPAIDNLQIAPTVAKEANELNNLNNSMQTNDTSFTVEYEPLNNSCEVSPPRDLSPTFLDKEGFELSPIRPDHQSDQYSISKGNVVLLDEPLSHIAGHPAEKHLHEAQSGKPVSRPPKIPDRLVNRDEGFAEQQMATTMVRSNGAGKPLDRLSQHLNDSKDDSQCSRAKLLTSVDDESTIISAFAFIETVAAIVIQTAIRRCQATRVANNLSHLRCNRELGNTRMKKISTNNDFCIYDNELPKDQIDSLAIPVVPNDFNREFANLDLNNTRTSVNTSFEGTIESAYIGSVGDTFLSLYEQAAIRIQAVFRSFWVRDSIDVDRYCATIIQKHLRRYLCERNYKLTSRRIIIVQSWWRRNIVRDYAGEIIAYVVWIQAIARGYIVRRMVQQLKTAKKSSQLSQIKRALSSRREYFLSVRSDPSSPIKSHPAVKRHIRNDNKVAIAAAVKIQTRWRAFVAESQFIRCLVDILIVQTVVRRWLACRYVRTLRGTTEIGYKLKEDSFQSHEDYCKNLESELLSIENAVNTELQYFDRPLRKVVSEVSSSEPYADSCRGPTVRYDVIQKTTIDRDADHSLRSTDPPVIPGEAVYWNTVRYSHTSSYDSKPFDESAHSTQSTDKIHRLQLHPREQARSSTSADPPCGKENPCWDNSKRIDHTYRKDPAPTVGDCLGRTAFNHIANEHELKESFSSTLPKSTAPNEHTVNSVKSMSAVQSPSGYSGYSGETNVSNVVLDSQSRVTTNPQAPTSKVINSNALGKSRRVEKFFSKGCDSNRSREIEPSNGIYAKSPVHEIIYEQTYDIPAGPTSVEIDHSDANDVFSMWKEKVKKNPTKFKNKFS